MKLQYTVDAQGVHIQGVTTSNSVIYDNDIIHDSPDVHYLWLKANRGEVKLVGNIATRDMHPQGDPNNTHWNRWVDFYNKAVAAGLKNIPAHVKGAGPQYLVRPSNGNIDQTVWQNNAGSDLIIAEARKASASKPLVIFVGGNASTVANAYLKDKSIADKVVVLHYAGYVTPGGTYNTMDKWSTYVVMKRMQYVVVSGDQYSYYNNQKPVPTTVNLSGMPANPFTKTLLDNWVGQYYATYKEAADAPPVLWFFNNGVIKNVVRKLENGQTTTSDTYDFLLVSQNDWAYLKSNAWLDYIRNPANHVPGTTVPPVEPPANKPPAVMITSGTTFKPGTVQLTADATDDEQVTKVEFFEGGNKLGEDATAPYSFLWDAPEGIFSITARATDNKGAVSTSVPVTIVVADVVVPPVEPPPIYLGSGYADVRDFGTDVGHGSNDDAESFTKAWNSLRGTGGKIIAPTPANFYNFKTTFQALPAGNQVWVDIEWLNSLANKVRYTGVSNKAAIRVLGLKSANWQGLHLHIEDGRTGVTAIDVITADGANSSTNTTFRNMRLSLGNGVDNIGVRTGAENGGNGDISHYTCDMVSVYGGGALKGQGDPIPGQYAFQNLGHNTLANTWKNCFVAQCDRYYTNITRDNLRRGNAAVTFLGCGGAHQGDDFVTAWQGPVTIIGGRWENGHRQFFKVAPHGGYQHIKVDGPVVKDYGAPGGTIIDIQQACSFALRDTVLTNGRSNTKFSNPIRLASNGRFGNLEISGGGILSDAAKPYTKTGTTEWNVTVNGLARMGDDSSNGNAYSAGFFDNEFGTRIK